MNFIEPDYALTRMGGDEWSFQTSSKVDSATQRFDDILDDVGGRRGMTSALRSFLNRYPTHIDALHHYAMCKLEEGKPLDAFAFAHAAVAIGRSAFPSEFILGNGRLSGDSIENRPFLRALYGLMLAQHKLAENSAAAATARESLHLDPHDRMGVRMLLPLYLLEEDRNREALEVFSIKPYENAFHTAEYLRALALLRLNLPSEARAVLAASIARLPEVAHFLVHENLPCPEAGLHFGMVVGGELEGWTTAVEQGHLWHRTPGAREMLLEVWGESKPKRRDGIT
jgi:hypothetical protein